MPDANAPKFLMAARSYCFAACELQRAPHDRMDLSKPPHYWPYTPEDWKPGSDALECIVQAQICLEQEKERLVHDLGKD